MVCDVAHAGLPGLSGLAEAWAVEGSAPDVPPAGARQALAACQARVLCVHRCNATHIGCFVVQAWPPWSITPTCFPLCTKLDANEACLTSACFAAGFTTFINFPDLRDPARGFLADDTLRVKVGARVKRSANVPPPCSDAPVLLRWPHATLRVSWGGQAGDGHAPVAIALPSTRVLTHVLASAPPVRPTC